MWNIKRQIALHLWKQGESGGDSRTYDIYRVCDMVDKSSESQLFEGIHRTNDDVFLLGNYQRRLESFGWPGVEEMFCTGHAIWLRSQLLYLLTVVKNRYPIDNDKSSRALFLGQPTAFWKTWSRRIWRFWRRYSGAA